jgi:hypothetical protein
MNGVEQERKAEDLLIGALAVLAKEDVDTLRIDDRTFHAAFGAALEVFRKAGGRLEQLSRTFYRDVVSKTYEKLDDALISAEHFGMVKFPNPSYSRLEITITPRVAEQLLGDWSDAERETFRDAAHALKSKMRYKPII